MSDSKKSPNKKNTGQKSIKKRNPNLRLVKNGDAAQNADAAESSLKMEGSAQDAVKSGAKTSGASKTESKAKASGAPKEESKAKASGASKTESKAKASGAPKEESKAKASGASKAESKTKASGASKSKGKGKSSAVTDKPKEKGKAMTASGVVSSEKGKPRASVATKAKDAGKSGGSKPDGALREYGRKPREEKRKGDWYLQHRSLVITGGTLLLTALLLIGACYYLVTTYTVTTVYVDGNVHYTNEEIMDMVMTGRYGKNSLYLAVKYRNKGVEGIPFVEKMDVNILSPDTIRINVYEKALAGYVEYLGRYMYFDKDGIVVESSTVRTLGIPQVTGLNFDYVILHEPLPIGNEEIFKKILNITQLLTKYDLAADRIFFDSAYEVTVYFDGVRVTLGDSAELDEKIMKLQYILPQLEGKKGILRMENYTEDTKNIPFNQD